MVEDWLARWAEGRTGWHEPAGNAALQQFWSQLSAGRRVLVPLCGKTPDLKWLADQGHDVIGVELSEIATRQFFDEQSITPKATRVGGLPAWQGAQITIACGDFFEFSDGLFDAVFDRGSLVALDAGTRPAYVEHLKTLMKPSAKQLLVTLEYAQDVVSGPPFSVLPNEVTRYWPNLTRIFEREDIDNCPPKFREAGLEEVVEAVWLG